MRVGHWGCLLPVPVAACGVAGCAPPMPFTCKCTRRFTAQVCKKKGVREGPKKALLADYSFGPHYVLTSAETCEMWTEKPSDVPKAVKLTFSAFDFRGAPMIAMTQLASAKDAFIAKAHAGEIGLEYIGNHGVGGLLWPPLESYDDHVRTWDRTLTDLMRCLACPLRACLIYPRYALQIVYQIYQIRSISYLLTYRHRSLP